MNTEIFELEKT